MRLLLLHSSFAARGGAELYVLRLASSLADRGHHVAVVTRHPPADAELDDRVALHLLGGAHLYDPDHGVGRPRPRVARALWHLADPWLPTSRADLGAAVRKHQPDLVHTHNIQGIGGGALPVLRHHAVVHTVHDYALIDPRTTLADSDGTIRSTISAPARLRSRIISRLHPVSCYVFPAVRVHHLHGQMGWSARGAATVVIPHGWSLDDPNQRSGEVASPSSEACEPTGAPVGEPRFVYLGRLDTHKGLPILLAAWERWAPAEATLWLYGSGPLESEIRQLVERVRGIHYGGFVSGAEKRAVLRGADALLFPSMWPETFGLVCAEALLSGTPIVASVQASPPVLQPGENGLLIDGTVQGWIGALDRLSGDRDLLRRLSAGAIRSRGALDWEAHVDAIERCYAITRRHHEGHEHA